LRSLCPLPPTAYYAVEENDRLHIALRSWEDNTTLSKRAFLSGVAGAGLSLAAAAFRAELVKLSGATIEN